MTFTAWLDQAPGKRPRLVVTGKAETPTSGWSGTLVPAPVQNAPQTLVLDAVLRKPTGATTPTMGQINLRYDETPAGGHTHVTVRLDGSEVTVPVDRNGP